MMRETHKGVWRSGAHRLVVGIDSAVAPLPLQPVSSKNVKRSVRMRLNTNMVRRLVRPLKNDRFVEEAIRWPRRYRIHLGIWCVERIHSR